MLVSCWWCYSPGSETVVAFLLPAGRAIGCRCFHRWRHNLAIRKATQFVRRRSGNRQVRLWSSLLWCTILAFVVAFGSIFAELNYCSSVVLPQRLVLSHRFLVAHLSCPANVSFSCVLTGCMCQVKSGALTPIVQTAFRFLMMSLPDWQISDSFSVSVTTLVNLHKRRTNIMNMTKQNLHVLVLLFYMYNKYY